MKNKAGQTCLLTRRRLLTITAEVVSATAVAGTILPGIVLADDDQPDESIQDALAVLAHDLFPHDDIPNQVYADIAGTIVAQEHSSTGDIDQVRRGIAELNSISNGSEWRNMGEQARLQALGRIEDSRFFNTMRDRIRGLMYLRQEVWQLIGYGGNALAQGGYLNRGFNDIDWLE